MRQILLTATSLLVFGVEGSSMQTTVNEPASEDTFITQHSGFGGPSSTHAIDPVIRAISASSFKSYPMIRFDLSPYGGAIVTSDATLVLELTSVHPVNASIDRTIGVHGVLADWNASTVNFNNFTSGGQPNFGALIDTVAVSQADVGPVGFVIPQATVQSWIDSPSTNFGVGLINQQLAVQFDANFSASEGTTPPRLLFDADLDLVAPSLDCPPLVVLMDRFGNGPGEPVFFTVTADDDRDPAPLLECVPPPGSFFPAGTTVVTCTATDAAGNESTCQFPVVVVPKARPVP